MLAGLPRLTVSHSDLLESSSFMCLVPKNILWTRLYAYMIYCLCGSRKCQFIIFYLRVWHRASFFTKTKFCFLKLKFLQMIGTWFGNKNYKQNKCKTLSSLHLTVVLSNVQHASLSHWSSGRAYNQAFPYEDKLPSLASGFGASVGTISSTKYFRENHIERVLNLSWVSSICWIQAAWIGKHTTKCIFYCLFYNIENSR